MNTKHTIAAFDFDGTVTIKDTFPAFIRFSKGSFLFFAGLLLYLPYLIAYKLKLYPNWKVKQQLFSFFFKGMQLADFNCLCKEFCRQSTHLIHPLAAKAIQQHTEKKNSIVIISASIENWVYPFAEQLGIPLVLCTKLEIDSSGRLTGRFASPNCYGEEKVKRLLQFYPQRNDYFLIAYGDSEGDRALLEFADEKFYRKFNSLIADGN
jgi:HAD superfamily hydrolase (TIGR01490 family)